MGRRAERGPAPPPPGLDGPAADALLRAGRFLRRAEVSPDGRAVYEVGGREGDVFYRDRWSHDKVVRSTHGVNCTGSCSWKVYVKDGIITWETQETDYPSVGPDRPEYEPRGCPRGAAFSWYTYSPTRVRYPYGRAVLLEMYREARARLGDPVAAWAEITGDQQRRRRYQSARGKGGLVRLSWDEAVEIIAAAHVHTIKAYGPDRVAGFSPIPAMSMVSHAAGSRFIELLGGVMTSFYDWYADLPVASPQVFGDQTDVPESGDWWDATYLVLWGSNVPVTRTPDAHWMAEVRYRGTKVVVVSPDYADSTKFADTWLPAQPGSDGAMAMAMGHVVLREFLVDRPVPFFTDFVSRYTDLPFLVTLSERDGALVPGKFLTAADLGEDAEGAAWKPMVLDQATGEAVAPNGSLGFRHGDAGVGRWNLDLGGIQPTLSLYRQEGAGGEAAEVLLPRFDQTDGQAGVLRRGVPVRRVGGRLVTTVFDLLLAQYGVERPGLPGGWPSGYDDAEAPYTPAWQEPITSVPAGTVVRVAREFARSAEQSRGRCMIIMGAGICQWFHGDATYRAVLALLQLTGCMGRNGGSWAHYVGQEKCRPLTGWSSLAMGLDWSRPPRQMIGTAFWYLHTDQWRYDGYRADALASPLAEGHLAGLHTADAVALSARLGWMPSYPQFDRNPLDLVAEARAAGADPVEHVTGRLWDGSLRFACEDPDDPRNWPRVLTLWRANLLGSSAKGIVLHPDREVTDLAHRNGVMFGGAGDGRPALDTDAKLAEAILALSATTNGNLAAQGFRTLERRVGRPLAQLAEGSHERRITFADTQAGPVPVITSPEWSGSETGGRRYAPFTTNVEQLKPWHTLTGRMHFLLDHDWIRDLGETLPIYRPPLDMRRLFGEPALGADGGRQVTVRYLTPHSKWSIHSEYQDNLLMLSLSRGGPTVWMHPADAGAIGVTDNQWVEAVNRNGILVARAIVSHRIPAGTVFVHHAQERTIDVPRSEANDRRGGIHNSLTRLLVKPTHLIGGYAQLSFAFNYLGPTGNQRDEVTVIRPRSQEVRY